MPLRGGDEGRPPLDFAAGARGDTADTETLDSALTIGTKIIIPLGLAVSCIAHVALLTPAAYFAGANPFAAAPADAIAVDIVSAEEAGEAADPETSKPESSKLESPKPESSNQEAGGAMPSSGASPSGARTLELQATETPSPAAPAGPSPPPPPASRAIAQDAVGRPAAAQAQPALPPLPGPSWMPQQFAAAAPDPAQPEETAVSNMFAMPLTLPDGKVGGRYDSQAVTRADLSNDAVTALRSHLKTCSTLPAGRLSPDVKVVVRVYLKRDGSLATGVPQNPEPIKVEGVSAGGGALFQSAVEAVRKCQPYRMLPPDRYEEWKSLDLTFTPQNF